MNPRIETSYKGFLSIMTASFSEREMERPDAPPTRCMQFMERGHAVSILVWHKTKRKFIVLKQFRIANFLDNGETSVYSNVAGMIDEGETAMQAAIRELKEELGVTALQVEDLGTFFTSPGGTTEKMTFMYAEVEGTPSPMDKEIHSFGYVTANQYMAKILSGEFSSAQMATAFFLGRYRACYKDFK